MKKSHFLTLLLMISLQCPLASQGVYYPVQKKLVEFSHSSPTTKDYSQNIKLYESGPFDGISVKLTQQVGGGNIFMVENWKNVDAQAREKELELIKNISEHTSLRYNFLAIYGASQMDWFSDDDWLQVETALRYAARLAKIGNFKGLLWDPEPYKPGKNPWRYPEQTKKGEYSYNDYYLQVRKRGAQFIKAIQEEYPGLVILSLREFSDFQSGSPFSMHLLPIGNAQETRTTLEKAWWGLHLPFTLGILDAIDDEVTFIDSNEEAYYYTSALEYYKIRNTLTDDVKALIPPGLHKSFKANYSLGHAVSADYIAGNWAGLNSFPYRLSAQATMLTPREKALWFEHNLYYALETSDEYVWLYSEEPNWFTGENVPEGFLEALKSARAKVQQKAPLGFSVEDMLENARDKAEAEWNKKQ